MSFLFFSSLLAEEVSIFFDRPNSKTSSYLELSQEREEIDGRGWAWSSGCHGCARASAGGGAEEVGAERSQLDLMEERER